MLFHIAGNTAWREEYLVILDCFNFGGVTTDYVTVHSYDAIILADHNLAICVKITNFPK